jgi:predicted metal-dependent hydrolase
MAEQLLLREDLTTQIDDEKMYKLWLWHAIEENEHKSVAYDAYQAVGGGYWIRTITMALSTVMFIGVIAWFQVDLLRKDGQLFNWKSWAYGLKTLFGPRNGYITGLLGPYLQYYKPGFHPAQQNTQQLEQRWRRRLGFNG